MAVSDFTGLGNCIRLYTRTGAGFSSSGDATDITGWTDDSSSSVDATNETNAPTHDDTPPTGTLGPAAEYADETDNGFDFGLNLSGVSTWTVGMVLYASTLSSFRNLFSSGGGAAEGSLYTNGGTLTYQEAATESTGSALSTGTLYTVVFYASATRYRVIVRDNGGTSVIDYTFSTIGTPSDQPSGFKIHTYGGSGAGWAGHGWAYCVYNADMVADDTAIHAALLEEAEGAAAVLTADQQSYTLTGQVATLTAARQLVATQQSYTLSGQDATLTYTPAAGYTLTADQQSYALTGQAAGLVYGRTLTADQQSYTLSGQAAGLARGYTLAADQQSYTLTGQPAALAAARQLVADQQSYTLTGQDATLAIGGTFADDFDGTGALLNYSTHNSAAVTSVERVSGRCVIDIPSDTGVDSQWYNADDGRLDYRALTWPFRIIIRNTGIGNTTADTQTAPDITGDTYMFGGYHINNDLTAPTDDYRHWVVGRRGSTRGMTVEAKTNLNGSSSVNDTGIDSIAGSRADLLIVGHADKTTNWYWQEPNTDPILEADGATADNWTEQTFPGSEPTWGDTVYGGPVAYAFEHYSGPAFVGTMDAIVDGSVLPATAQTYALTGQDATLTAARKITADQQSYALTGQDAALTYSASNTLDAEQASFVLTGQPAALAAARQLAADQQSYTLTGQDATLQAGRTLTADQQSYTLSGQAAGLAAARQLVADQQSYTLTGQDADLVFSSDATLTADQASYVLSGQAAALVAARQLAADQQSYTLTGQAATLSLGRAMAAAMQTYALSGQAATLVAARTLAAAQQSYTLSGQDVAFTYSGTPAMSPVPPGVYHTLIRRGPY